jgi:two-component system chemotaxis sensor kinase CheA
MDRERLIQRLMATFLGELDEHVATLNAVLLDLERQPDAERRAEGVRKLFRAAHSLKGAARAVELPPIEAVCHRLEDLLSQVRDAQREITAELFDILYASVDALQDAGRRVAQKRSLEDGPLVELGPRLEKALGRSDPASAVSPPRIAASVSPRPSARPAALGESTGPRRESEPALDTVRVRVDKLDAVSSCGGELSIGLGRARVRLERVEELRENLQRLLATWRQLESPLVRWFESETRSPTSSRIGGRTSRLARPTFIGFRERVGRLQRDVEALGEAMARDAELTERAAGRVNDEIRRLRMFPFADACHRLDRAVRDITNAKGNQAALVIEGGEVELDRSVLEGLKDPLMHLVRNAADHGIEPPEVRRAAGKPPAGRIVVSASLRGGSVAVEVGGDGRGLDLESIRRIARSGGRPEPKDDAEAAELIFAPGISTSTDVTEVSGRGVGLDVVRSRVASLRGRVEARFTPGEGASFQIVVPLTLTNIRALLVEAAGQTYCLPTADVEKLLRVAPADVQRIDGRDVVMEEGRPLPIVPMAEALGLADAAPADPEKALSIVVPASDRQRVGLIVDRLADEREILVKSLGPRLSAARSFAGGAILESGRVALIPDMAELVRRAGETTSRPAASRAAASPARPIRKRLLLVDDSITTRSLVGSILESAGYDVTLAVDGEQAWRLVRERGTDLLISDIEMPNMDGIELTEAMRASKSHREIPIVLVTSLTNDIDRARGLNAGADAYLVKSAFDRAGLLETIEQLL